MLFTNLCEYSSCTGTGRDFKIRISSYFFNVLVKICFDKTLKL